jgi:hypothetical protein
MSLPLKQAKVRGVRSLIGVSRRLLNYVGKFMSEQPIT